MVSALSLIRCWSAGPPRRTVPSHAETVERAGRMVRDTPPEGYAGCCEAIRDMDMRARLGAIRAPTLLITGADDLVTRPEHARLICGSISESRLVVIPQAAHLANIEQPVAVIQAVLYHLGPVAERRVG